MKHLTLSLLALALLCGSATAKKIPKVFICTGKTAKAYHTNRNCEGLVNCKGEIKQIKKSKAVKQGRHFCSYCKKNVTLQRRDGVQDEEAD